jgi:hypothetical protein
VVIALSATPVLAAEKLIVKDGQGGKKFVVTDNGAIGAGVAAPAYQLDISALGQSNSQIHLSLDGADSGGWLTSVGENNLFLSAGAVWKNGAWEPRLGSSTGPAWIWGGGVAGFRIKTLDTAGSLVRFRIDSDGLTSIVGGEMRLGEDQGGRINSVQNVSGGTESNLYLSSGSRYDGTKWVLTGTNKSAVVFGGGPAGFQVVNVDSTGGNPLRLQIDQSGAMGLNAPVDPAKAITTASGAYLSSGGVWTNASSRALKKDIQALSRSDALEALRELQAVTFRYKAEPGQQHVGFIAEDVPALVATKDRKGLSPMEIVAVLTRVVQEQQATIAGQQKQLEELRASVKGSR